MSLTYIKLQDLAFFKDVVVW